MRRAGNGGSRATIGVGVETRACTGSRVGLGMPGLGADLAPAVSVGVSVASWEGVFGLDEAFLC